MEARSLLLSCGNVCLQILVESFAANAEVSREVQFLFFGGGAAAQLFDPLRRQGFLAATVSAALRHRFGE